jgi:hypothetical protein
MTIIIPEPFGSFFSYTFKTICILVMSIVTFSMLKKYQKKRTLLLRNMTLMFLSYNLVPIIAIFNTLFNLRNFPYENSYIILYLGFIFVAIGNCIYYWFIIDVFYRANHPEFSYRKYLTPVISIHFSFSIIAFILRLVNLNEISLILIIIHVFISVGIYILLLYNAVHSYREYSSNTMRKRFMNIGASAICGIITVIFIVGDSLFSAVSLLNLLSWVSFGLNTVFCFFGFVGRRKDGQIALIEEKQNRKVE